MDAWFRSTSGGRNHELTDHMVNAVWGLHKRWSMIARKRRKALSFFQRLSVTLISTGAILQTLSYQVDTQYEWIFSLIAGACLGSAPFITHHFLSHEKMSEWVASRATSESLKAEVFKFRSGVRPYHRDNSVEVLAKVTTEILEPTTEFDSYDKLDINTILWSPDQVNSLSLQKKKDSDFKPFVSCQDYSK